MNKIQRKLFLSLFFVLAVSVGIITAIVAHVIREGQLARFGDIFDRVAFEQMQAWVAPTLFAICGISLVVILMIVGLWKFYGDEPERSASRVKSDRKKSLEK